MKFLTALLKRLLSWPPAVCADCPIPWQPSVFAPVFYGIREYSVDLPPTQVVSRVLFASGGGPSQPLPGSIPVRFRVFFPSLDGSPFAAPILASCGRYPLILFAHGHCSDDANQFRTWYELPATLARSGNVVVVPDLPLTGGGRRPSENDQEIELVRRLLAWMRSDWEHNAQVMPAPATGLVGHSFGAGLTARLVAEKIVGVRAYASLSGHAPTAIRTLSLPKLLVWGTGSEDLLVPIVEWVSTFSAPVHVVELDGASHWDYIPQSRAPCAHNYGPCSLFPFLTADLVAIFFARYIPPETWANASSSIPSWLPFFRIAASLRPPTLLLSQEQKFFAAGHLAAWKLLSGRSECGLTLNWKTASGTGSLRRD